MSVVNCKVKYIRPQYANLEEWMAHPDNIYIARQGVVFVNQSRFPKKSSLFANPYKIGRDGTREEVIDKYKQHITTQLDNGQLSIHDLLALKGKNLGCWCHPEPCHGDILLSLIKTYDNNR